MLIVRRLLAMSVVLLALSLESCKYWSEFVNVSATYNHAKTSDKTATCYRQPSKQKARASPIIQKTFLTRTLQRSNTKNIFKESKLHIEQNYLNISIKEKHLLEDKQYTEWENLRNKKKRKNPRKSLFSWWFYLEGFSCRIIRCGKVFSYFLRIIRLTTISRKIIYYNGPGKIVVSNFLFFRPFKIFMSLSTCFSRYPLSLSPICLLKFNYNSESYPCPRSDRENHGVCIIHGRADPLIKDVYITAIKCLC